MYICEPKSLRSIFKHVAGSVLSAINVRAVRIVNENRYISESSIVYLKVHDGSLVRAASRYQWWSRFDDDCDVKLTSARASKRCVALKLLSKQTIFWRPRFKRNQRGRWVVRWYTCGYFLLFLLARVFSERSRLFIVYINKYMVGHICLLFDLIMPVQVERSESHHVCANLKKIYLYI